MGERPVRLCAGGMPLESSVADYYYLRDSNPMKTFKLHVLAALLAAPGVLFAQEPVKVGIANDISGPFSALGAEARDGFNLAIKALDGKLGGLPAEFIQTDMGGNPDQARQLVNRYLQRE